MAKNWRYMSESELWQELCRECTAIGQHVVYGFNPGYYLNRAKKIKGIFDEKRRLRVETLRKAQEESSHAAS